MSYSVRKHWLLLDGKPVKKVTTRCKSHRNGGRWIKPKYGVLHYTVSPTAKSAISALCGKNAKASCHLILDYDGRIIQTAPLNTRCWHAGKSHWDGIKGLNSHSIGIEVVNPGWLTPLGDGTFRSTFGKVYDKDQVVISQHANGSRVLGWLPFTEQQMHTIFAVGEALNNKYKLREWVGHDMIAPKRKQDPGPCFPDMGYGRLNGRLDDTVEYIVKTPDNSKLNLRDRPSSRADIVTQLEPGSIVDVLRNKGGWRNVVTDKGKIGWVYHKYLKWSRAKS